MFLMAPAINQFSGAYFEQTLYSSTGMGTQKMFPPKKSDLTVVCTWLSLNTTLQYFKNVLSTIVSAICL